MHCMDRRSTSRWTPRAMSTRPTVTPGASRSSPVTVFSSADEKTVTGELLDAPGVTVGRVDIALGVHRDVLRRSMQCITHRPPFQVDAGTVELLDAVGSVRHVNIAATVHRHTPRPEQLPRAEPRSAPLRHVGAVCRELLDSAVPSVSHVDIAGGIHRHGQIVVVELPVTVAERAPLREKRAIAIELLDATVFGVRDVENSRIQKFNSD